MTILPSHMLLQVADDLSRKIAATVCSAVRRKAEQKQPGAAANLEHALGLELLNALHGRFHPFLHFLGRNQFTGVTAGPADEIERCVPFGFGLSVGLIPNLMPIFHLLM